MKISLLSKILLIFFFLTGVFFVYQYTKTSEDTVKTEKEEPREKSSSKNFFDRVLIEPDIVLNGEGDNIDSPEFFIDGENSLLIVSDKKGDLLEVWKYPFTENSFSSVKRDSLPNGLAVDQDKKLLLIGDSEKEIVETRSLPGFEKVSEIGKDTIKPGETNVDVLTLPQGQRHVYVTGSHSVHILDLENGKTISSFEPTVESVEEVLADSYHQIIYIPDEAGKESDLHPGGAITAYHPDGTLYLKEGVSAFGKKVFSQDGEGITLYSCRDKENKDTGKGVIIVSDQRDDLNDYEFFDRETWQHLGTLQIKGVAFTDGISVSSYPLPNYPMGIFAAVNNDKSTAIVSWEKIANATGVTCE